MKGGNLLDDRRVVGWHRNEDLKVKDPGEQLWGSCTLLTFIGDREDLPVRSRVVIDNSRTTADLDTVVVLVLLSLLGDGES